jgi:hypothetical protein
MENALLRNIIWDKRKEVQILQRRQEKPREKLEDGLNIFTREAVLSDLNEWEDQFKGKIEKEMMKRRE